MTPRPCDLLIRASILATQNPERDIVHDAGLAVRSGTVLATGDYAEVAAIHSPERELDLRGHLVLPGLINAHTHSPMTLFRGFCDDLPLLPWLHSIFPIESRLTPDLVRTGALLACMEMARTGTTAFMDGYMLMESVGDAVRESGLRAVIAEGFFSFPSPMFPTAEDAWATLERLRNRYLDVPLVDTAIFPHAIYTTDDESLKASFAIAERHDCPWQIHCAENPEETRVVLEKHGKRPIEYLHELGVLSPRTVLHHMTDVNDGEIELVARSGAVIVHNPESNMKLASGIAPVARFLEAGIPVALGTDGAASNNDLNMFTEMTSAALLQKVATRDARALDAQTVLDMATLGGARALGRTDLGSLEPGKSADLCALTLDAPSLMPMHNPVAAAVYSACGHENVLTMVAGKIVYDHGTFPGIDLPALRTEAERAADWVRKAAGTA